MTEDFGEFVKPGGRFFEVVWSSNVDGGDIYPGQYLYNQTGAEIKIGEQTVRFNDEGHVINQDGIQIGAYLTVIRSQATKNGMGIVFMRLDEPQSANLDTSVSEK